MFAILFVEDIWVPPFLLEISLPLTLVAVCKETTNTKLKKVLRKVLEGYQGNTFQELKRRRNKVLMSFLSNSRNEEKSMNV